jgi:imidazolonepropionase-like amidohydrolase
MLSKGIPPEQQSYSDEEIRAAVTEANRWGRTVAAHAHGTAGIKAAIRAGVRSVDHGSMLDAEAIAMLKGDRPATSPLCISGQATTEAAADLSLRYPQLSPAHPSDC